MRTNKYGVAHGGAKIGVSWATTTGVAAAIALIPGVDIAAAGVIDALGIGIIASDLTDSIADNIWRDVDEIKIVRGVVGD